ncbi:MAG: ankyrin repeat domain-containing protein [Nannocystaceae bacterium]
MTWTFCALYAENKAALRERLLAHPLLGPALHHLRPDPRGAESLPLPPAGLLVVPNFGPPDHPRMDVEVPWDALLGPPRRLTYPAPADLAGHGLSPRAWPPAPTLYALKDMSIQTGSPIVLYRGEMWGGDIDLEAAWVPGWASAEPDRVLWHAEGGAFVATASSRPTPLGRDVPRAALEYLRVRLPSAYFLPHTRGFEWSRARIGAPAAEGAATPPSLYRCVDADDLEGARACLDAGADPNAYESTTPLEHAAERGQLALVDLLLERGADPSPPGHLSALHVAHDRATAERILAAGVPVDGDPRYYSPLLRAAMRGDDAVARLLLDRGATLHPSAHPDAPWFAACEGGLVWMIDRLLVEGASIDRRRDGEGPTGLELAAGAGHEAAAARLVAAGAGLDARTLVAAAHGGLAGLVGEHLARGIAADARRHDEPALVAAIREGHPDVVAILIDAGADLRRVHHGRTLLHLAAELEDPTVIERLLEHEAVRATLEVRDPVFGWTPLFVAAWYGRREVAAALLRRGAIVDVLDRNDRRSLDVARRHDLDLAALAASIAAGE